MFRVVGAEHLLALVRLVDGVFLGHLHGAHEGLGLHIPERHFLSDRNGLGQAFLGGKGDRNRPEQILLARQGVVFAAALPVCLAHEAIERRKGADAHHDQIAGLAAGDGNLLQALRFLDPSVLAWPSSKRGFSSGLPCGGTSLLIVKPPKCEIGSVPGTQRQRESGAARRQSFRPQKILAVSRNSARGIF